MRFEAGNDYRAKATDAQIETIETTGTVLIEVMLEITLGPLLGRRIRWRGWLNSEKNVKAAVEALRAMGWRGERFGDWIGLGTKEIRFQCEISKKVVDGKERSYPEAAFVRPLEELRPRNPTSKEAVDGLSQRFGGLLSFGVPSERRPSSSRGESAPPTDDGFDDFDSEAPSDDFDQQSMPA